MLIDDEATDTGYKFHCLEIEMEELKQELIGLRNHIAHRDFLMEDTKEITSHFGKHQNMFLFKTYW